MITWRARNESEQLRDLERSFRGMIAGSILFMLSALQFHTPTFRHGMFMLALLMFASSCSMILQLRKARQVLEKSKIANQKS